MSRLAEKAKFKEWLYNVIEQFKRDSGEVAKLDYVGAQYAHPLEHATRRHLIDHMLVALGWNLDQMNEDIVEEARVKGATTLFLDYLGVNPESRVPRIIIEAKAWAKPLVTSSSAGKAKQGASNKDSYSALLANAIQHCKNEGAPKDSPVTVEWAEWLAALHDYVAAIKDSSGHAVSCVAISSGQWLVLFIDPETIFLQPGNVASASISVFIGDQMVEESDYIFDRLARVAVVNDIPAWIRPSLVPAFTAAVDIARIFRALWITRVAEGAHFQRHPQLTLYVALVVQRQDGGLLTILDDQLAGSVIPHDYDELPSHIEGVFQLSNQLLRSVCNEFNVEFVPWPISDFPGFDSRTTDRGDEARLPQPPGKIVELLKPWRKGPNEFLLVLGIDAHFLRPRPEVASCGFHDWAVCNANGQSQGANPISARSVEPTSFFYTGEGHHCAHRVVHDRRNTHCQIDAFEKFLCCRACALQTFCWNGSDLTRLPCGTVPQRELAEPPDEPDNSSEVMA